MSKPSRIQAGVQAGGQFTTATRGESTSALKPSAAPEQPAALGVSRFGKFATMSDAAVRRFARGHDELKPSRRDWIDLRRSPDVVVRALAAAKVPASQWKHLARDPAGSVRRRLAANPHVSSAQLSQMSSDDSAGVRREVAREGARLDQAVPGEIAGGDRSWRVRRAAKRSLAGLG